MVLSFISEEYSRISLDLEPFVVNHVGSALNSLLKKRDLLTREDLVLQWRPLYLLYERLFHTNLESLGLIKLPHSIGPTVSNLIKYSRPYFPFEATEVILSVNTNKD